MVQGTTATRNPGATTRNPMGASSSNMLDMMETLEQGVREAAHDANTAVKDILHTVNHTADRLKTRVGASLTHALDLRQQVRQHPWLMLGGAALVGYLVGKRIRRARSRWNAT